MKSQEQTMMFMKILAICGLLIVLVILTSCTAKPKPANKLDPIANARELGKALGCVFAPNTCKSKEEIKREQDEITKEFDKIDAQKAKEAQNQ
jgi:hypothetical protein